MSNFIFLSEWEDIQTSAQSAEKIVRSDPRTSCFHSRRTLELTVKWMYRYDKWLKEPYDNKLASLIHDPVFKNSLPSGLSPKLVLIQKIGNQAVHSDAKLSERDSLQVLKELHHFLYWFCRTYSGNAEQVIGSQSFSVELIPQFITLDAEYVAQNAKKVRELAEQLAEKDRIAAEQLAEKERESQALQAELERLQAQIADAKLANRQFHSTHPDTHNYNEAETRQYLIDQYLREAGWDLANTDMAESVDNVSKKRGVTFEHEVDGMPNTEKVGYVDFVLWGQDGRPLAVIEAKRTAYSAKKGQQQAVLYANCLEEKYQQRPLIFYTNGYEIYFWDDAHYPERQVQGFYTQDELARLIQQRHTRQPLREADINKEIAGRYYQEQAIRSICEQFENHHQRRSLLVMATGTGKTRTTIALVELLMKNNWVKNVLFLADRNALVSQAKTEFSQHMPSIKPTILSSSINQIESRLCFSTYQTMMSLLNEPPEERLFSVGHFDLVIVDEAHRSLYKKFRYIFDYFDSLLLGLTATPKDEVDKNTYDVFGLETGVPTYAYEADQAYADGYLVPPKAMSVPLKFIREGVKFSELTAEEQEEWDETDGLVGRDEVLPSEVNRFLYNEDTVDKMLAHLMEHGVKTGGGDQIAKTIIFAANNKHAEFIEKRFNENYPKWKGRLARVITYKQDYAESIINEFKLTIPPTDPNTPNCRIAISVDMLDTGIDVPEVANLIFFKVVRSQVKFFQMLGRGTRLCEDLFGPGQDKQYFKVFDYCQNFEYFTSNPEGISESRQRTLSQAIFENRLELAAHLNGQEETELLDLRNYLNDLLHHDVAHMNLNNFIVRPKRKVIEKYLTRDRWNNIGEEDRNELVNYVATLPTESDPFNEYEINDELAKRFDVLILRMQLSVLQGKPVSNDNVSKLILIAEQLEQKSSIPAVSAQLLLIQEMQTNGFWERLTVLMLEKIRRQLRGLMRFIDKEEKGIVFTNFEDEMGVATEVVLSSVSTSLAQYRKKVEHFIRSHEDQFVIKKLKNNKPITEADLITLEKLLFEASGMDSQDEYKKLFGSGKPLGQFVRELVGLDRVAAKEAFADFLDEGKYNARQIEFINQLIDFLTANGVMESDTLFESPFTDLHEEGVCGYYSEVDIEKLVARIQAVNRNVMPGVRSGA